MQILTHCSIHNWQCKTPHPTASITSSSACAECLPSPSFLVVPRVHVGEPSRQQQFEATPHEWRVIAHPIVFILLSMPADKKNKNIISLSCCFSSFFPLWSGAPGHSPAKASLCSWKNDLNDKLHTGLLRSGLFLAHLYKNPHSKKKKERNLGEAQTPSAAWRWDKHYVMLRLFAVTIGRANSTKSSMRTGHAPKERE